MFNLISEYRDFEVSLFKETSQKQRKILEVKISQLVDRIIDSLTISHQDDNLSKKTLALKVMLLFKFFGVPRCRMNGFHKEFIRKLIHPKIDWDEIEPITRLLT